ncbi:hypothetical protein [Nannocystis sp.]|uniref:hypothetical protein n=1 Tax=Nannocystis sp. TaxID=1962667 RepID=UPI0025D2B97D|nr:hypothetical protein [Nannocystis sp.]MBK7827514.1 hypothetical protein [Nannocystis sp.]
MNERSRQHRRRNLRRLAAAGLGLLVVALVGSVAAKPTANGKAVPAKASKLDPVWARALTPKPMGEAMGPAAMAVARDQAMKVPAFAVKRLTPVEKGDAMGVAPAAIQGPLVYDSRTLYHDDENYMELISTPVSSMTVRTKRNYLYIYGSEAGVLAPYNAAGAELHFTAAPRTRYLLECAVEAGPTMMISATDERAQYSVSTDDKATLLYRRDNPGASPEPVVVRIAADRNQWYIDRCELSWAPL